MPSSSSVVGGIDHEQMEKMRAYLSQLSAGWQVQTVRDIVAETLHTIVDPMVYDEAVDLIEEHRAAGRDVVIVSTSGAEVVEPIGEMLGVDHVIATQMVVEAGRYTGEIAFYAFGPNKAAAIRELAAAQDYDLSTSYGYSDSETDLPLLEAVGRPHAVNPDRTLRRAATSGDGRCCASPARWRSAGGWASGRARGSWWCCWSSPRVWVQPWPGRCSGAGPPERATRERGGQTTLRTGLPPPRGVAYKGHRQLNATRCTRVPTRRSTLPTGQSPSGQTRDDGERMHAW